MAKREREMDGYEYIVVARLAVASALHESIFEKIIKLATKAKRSGMANTLLSVRKMGKISVFKTALQSL